MNNNPRSYTGPKPPKIERQVLYPVPLSGRDYLAIALRQASSIDFKPSTMDSSKIRKHHISCSPIFCMYYIKAFLLSFGKFCHRLADYLDESDSKSSYVLFATVILEALENVLFQASLSIFVKRRAMVLQTACKVVVP